MPQSAKPARLFSRKDTEIWYIRDGPRQYSTRTKDRKQAEAALAAYIAERDRPSEPATPAHMTVAEALELYGTQHAPTVRDPARIGYAMDPLVHHLGSLPVASITSDTLTCYAIERAKASGTIRRELGVLRAALTYCKKEGRLTEVPHVSLPKPPPPRDRWLTRGEVAKLLRTASRNPDWRHLVSFILVAVYTGTRSGAILQLRFMPSTEGGWVDTAAGLLYRRGTCESETAKRRPTIPVPRRLLAHLKRWEANGQRYVVEIRGQRVKSVKTAWRSLLHAAGVDHCTRHDLRHTAITWAMQRGMDKWEACGYFGISWKELERTYGHHHPNHLKHAAAVMDRRG